MCRVVLCLLVLCASAVPSSVLAQTDRIKVTEGDRVRVSSSTARGLFVVAGMRSDTLILHRRTPSLEAFHLPLHSITRLEVARARSRGAGALRGAKIGFLIGAGGGAVIGLASGDDPPGFLSFSAEEKAVAMGVLLGGSGVVVGSIAGLAAPGERWERVDRDQRFGFSRTSNGNIALTYSYRF